MLLVAYSDTPITSKFNNRDLFIWKEFLENWHRFSYVHSLSIIYVYVV